MTQMGTNACGPVWEYTPPGVSLDGLALGRGAVVTQ
jgi:hypothetical protein